MTNETADSLAVDVKQVNGAKRSEVVFQGVLCSSENFLAGELTDGRFAAMWHGPAKEKDQDGNEVDILGGHVDVYDSLDSMVAALNVHERQLLQFEIQHA